MTAEEEVKAVFPLADLEVVRGGKGEKSLFFVTSSYNRGSTTLGKGNTKAKAWTDAKNNLPSFARK